MTWQWWATNIAWTVAAITLYVLGYRDGRISRWHRSKDDRRQMTLPLRKERLK
jgi:hypothetical protein